MRPEKQEAATTRNAIAQHALSCGPCKLKVKRLVHSASHIERGELLCQIEHHAWKAERRWDQ